MRRQLALLAVLACAGLPQHAQGAGSGIRERWRVPVISPDDRATPNNTSVQTVIDPARSRAYQIMALRPVDGRADQDVELTVFDLRTGRPIVVRRLPIDVPPDRGGPHYAYDASRGWLVLATGDRLESIAGPVTARLPGTLHVIDVAVLERGGDPGIAQAALPLEFTNRFAFHFEIVDVGVAPKIRLITSAPANTRTTPTLVQFDARSGDLDWRLDISPCADASTQSSVMTASNGRTVYVTCSAPRSGLEVVVPVALIDGAPAPGATLSAFGAERQLVGAAGDPVSERIAFVSGDEVTVFDGRSRRFIGRSAIPGGTANSFAVDPGFGRLYILNGNGLFTSAGQVQASGRVDRGGLQSMDLRTTPPGQFVNLSPDLRYPALTQMQVVPPGSGHGPLINMRRAGGEEDYSDERFKGSPDSDYRYPDGKQIFLMDELFARVIEDRTPETLLPSFADIDRLTTGIPEEPGRTSATMDASASGYGLRVLAGSGPSAPLRHSEYWDVAELLIRDRGGLPGCWFNDRELVGGLIERTRVTDAGATAAAAGDVLDPRTIGDAETPGDRCRPSAAADAPPVDGGVDLSASIAECVDEGGGSVTGRTPGSVAEISCDAAARMATGDAWLSPIIVGPISVAGSATRTRVEPDDQHGGLRAITTSWVHGIDIAGLVRIDLASSQATVWSNGRPADDRAALVRIVCGIHPSAGPAVEGCIPAEDAEPILNKILEGRGRVRVPEADAAFLRGSPGGYVAGVTKPLAEDLEDQLVRRDFRQEVPALEIAGFSDSLFFGHAEQRFQFAGVRAVVAYGVSCMVPFQLDAASAACVEQVVEPDPVPNVRPTVPPPTRAPTERSEATSPPNTDEPAFAPPVAVANEITQLLVRSLGDGLSAAVVWLLIGLPLSIASRRWAHDAAVRR